MIFPREGKIESGRRARGDGDSVGRKKCALKFFYRAITTIYFLYESIENICSSHSCRVHFDVRIHDGL
jgi:hypothetical protein